MSGHDKDANSGADGDMPLPSDAELDALQKQINDALEGVAARQKEEGPDSDNSRTEDESPEADKEPTPQQAIEALQTELANTKDQALRALAEAENVKRRAEREVATAKLYGIERFASDILAVHDNLARAILTLDGKAKEDMGANAKNLLDGIELTEKDLMAVLARHGIKAVPGKGSKFDPNVHQAVAQIPSTEEKGYVAEVMQTGFTIGERTLRAAMVAVSTGPAK